MINWSKIIDIKARMDHGRIYPADVSKKLINARHRGDYIIPINMEYYMLVTNNHGSDIFYISVRILADVLENLRTTRYYFPKGTLLNFEENVFHCDSIHKLDEYYDKFCRYFIPEGTGLAEGENDFKFRKCLKCKKNYLGR